MQSFSNISRHGVEGQILGRQKITDVHNKYRVPFSKNPIHSPVTNFATSKDAKTKMSLEGKIKKHLKTPPLPILE